MKTGFLGLLCCMVFAGCASVDQAHISVPASLPVSLTAYRSGMADARHDIARGTLATETFGLPAFWIDEYAEILRKKYRVNLWVVAGCRVDEDIMGHAYGYNLVAEAEIKRRFGGDVYDRTEKEAERLHLKRHPIEGPG